MSETAPEFQVSVEQLSDVERRLDVEIPWDQVRGRLDEAYLELGQGVTIKGFRRGKVPRKLLEQMFGQVVHKEVSQRLVSESLPKAAVDNGLRPVAEPRVEQEELIDGEAFRYRAVLEVVPAIEPRDYFGVEVEEEEPQVTEAAVQRALEGKRNECTQYRPIEQRATQPGDVLFIDVMGKIGDEAVSFEDMPINLGDPSTERIPGLAAKLTGIEAVAQELEVEFEVPPRSEGEESRAARLLVTIKHATEMVVPALDDELAKDTGEAETLDELTEKIRQKLLEADRQRCRTDAEQRLMTTLVQRNEVPVSPALVEARLDGAMRLHQMFGGDSSDEASESLREVLRQSAEDAVRAALLIEAIGAKEGVEVDDTDVEAKLAELARERGQNVARVRSEYERDGRMDQLRDALRERKTLKLLMSKSVILAKAREEAVAEPSGVSVAEEPPGAV